MTPLELLVRARQQSEVTVQRTIRVPGPELVRVLESGRPLLVSELTSHPDQHFEQRLFRYGHLLGIPVSDSNIAEWQRRHPGALLPLDVLDLLKTADGVHLWADLDTGRSYFGILPLAEWLGVQEHEARALFEDEPPGTTVLSYHHNSDYFLLLNPEGDRFTWFDPQSPDDSEVVGSSVDDLLSWWWNLAQELDPRTEVA